LKKVTRTLGANRRSPGDIVSVSAFSTSLTEGQWWERNGLKYGLTDGSSKDSI